MLLKKIFKKKRNRAYAALLFIITLACLWAFIYAGSVTKSFKEKLVNQAYETKEAGAENLLITETKDGRKLWEMYSETGMYAEKNGIVLLENLLGNVYNDEKNVTASFKADRGTYNTEKKQIVLYDNVIMVYEDGTAVYTDKLIYSGSGEDIEAIGSVRIERPDEAAVLGEKAVLSGDYKKFNIEGRTVTHFYMQDSKNK